MKTLSKLIGMVALILLSIPSQAANELIYGVKNEYTLMGFLGGGVFLLFSCILALIFLLYKVLPMLLKKGMEQQQKEREAEAV